MAGVNACPAQKQIECWNPTLRKERSGWGMQEFCVGHLPLLVLNQGLNSDRTSRSLLRGYVFQLLFGAAANSLAPCVVERRIGLECGDSFFSSLAGFVLLASGEIRIAEAVVDVGGVG